MLRVDADEAEQVAWVIKKAGGRSAGHAGGAALVGLLSMGRRRLRGCDCCPPCSQQDKRAARGIPVQ